MVSSIPTFFLSLRILIIASIPYLQDRGETLGGIIECVRARRSHTDYPLPARLRSVWHIGETDKVEALIEVRVCKEVRTFGTLQEG